MFFSTKQIYICKACYSKKAPDQRDEPPDPGLRYN